MYCVMQASAPSLHNVYRLYDILSSPPLSSLSYSDSTHFILLGEAYWVHAFFAERLNGIGEKCAATMLVCIHTRMYIVCDSALVHCWTLVYFRLVVLQCLFDEEKIREKLANNIYFAFLNFNPEA